MTDELEKKLREIKKKHSSNPAKNTRKKFDLEAKLTEIENFPSESDKIEEATITKHPFWKKYLITVAAVLALCSGYYVLSNSNIEYFKEKRVYNSYSSEFNGIHRLVANEKYAEIGTKIKELAAKLENEKYASTKPLLENVKNYNYTKLVYFPKKTEKNLVKEGYNEQVWVEPKYETKTNFRPGNFLHDLENIAGPEKPKGIFETERVLVKEGHYEKGAWHPPVYQDVLSPAHYKKIQVNPYAGNEKRIEDFIPADKVKK